MIRHISILCAVWFMLSPSALSLAQGDALPSLFSPDAQPIEDWQARFELATLLADTGRYAEAEAEYRKVLKVKPEYSKAKVGLAKVLMWSGRQKEAGALLDDIDQASLKGSDRMLLIDLAVARKDFAEAERLLRDYLKTAPDDLRARLKLAEVLSWTDQFTDSADEYRRILEVRPEDTQVRRRYAQVLAWAGKNDEAIKELRKTLAE